MRSSNTAMMQGDNLALFFALFSNKFPQDGLVFFTKDGTTDSIGLSTATLDWSASGPVADGAGGFTEELPVHSEGIWVGPSYTRVVGQPTPDGYPEIPEETTSASMVATSGGNGLAIEMVGERPDRVELWVDPPTRNEVGDPFFSTYDAVTDIARIVSDGTSFNMTLPNVLTIGEKYQIVFTLLAQIGGAVRDDFTVSNTTLDTSMTYTGIADSTDISIKRVSAVCDVTFKLSVQKLEPYEDTELLECFTGSPVTATFSNVFGFNSTAITSPLSIATVNDTVEGLVFLDAGGTIKSTDGTNTATVTVAGGYSALDRIFSCVQVSADGLTMRVGYVKNDESSVTFGSSVPYVGTYGPGTHMRFAFGGDMPQWWGGLAQYKIAQEESDVMKVVKELRK